MRYIIGLLLFGILLSGCISMGNMRTTTTVNVGDHSYIVDVVSHEADQERGLSGTNELPSNHGMLFVYDVPRKPTFWMKGMRFAIDILWISNNNVIGIEHAVPPDNGARQYLAPAPIDAVLELAAGTAQRDNLAVGNTVTMPKDAWQSS